MGDGRAPRLKDVAVAAGVHVSTASRALNEQTTGLVNPETTERVRQAAHALGYRINGMARALKTRRSLAIGMLVPDITNPFFPPIVRGAEDAFAEAGYSLVLSNTDNDPDKARRQLAAMLETRVDGLLLATALRNDELVAELAASDTPVALVNRTVDADADGATVSAAVPDDHLGVALAVEHLYQLGHRRIAYLGGPLDVSNGHRRRVSFDQAARRLGLDQAVAVEAAAFNEAEGRRGAAALLGHALDANGAGSARPTAIMAGNDLMALGVLDAAAARGLACPRDLSVVGFNDMPLADRMRPPLTTVRVAEYDLGRRAAELLLATIDNPRRSPETVLLAPELVVRGSTGPAPSSS
ncbi:MAG TPA: LacI family DNA-binding transcriptional regulator [Actinomycetota bacterium]